MSTANNEVPFERLLEQLRSAHYCGPAYVRGRPAYWYFNRYHRGHTVA